MVLASSLRASKLGFIPCKGESETQYSKRVKVYKKFYSIFSRHNLKEYFDGDLDSVKHVTSPRFAYSIVNSYFNYAPSRYPIVKINSNDVQPFFYRGMNKRSKLPKNVMKSSRGLALTVPFEDTWCFMVVLLDDKVNNYVTAHELTHCARDSFLYEQQAYHDKVSPVTKRSKSNMLFEETFAFITGSAMSLVKNVNLSKEEELKLNKTLADLKPKDDVEKIVKQNGKSLEELCKNLPLSLQVAYNPTEIGNLMLGFTFMLNPFTWFFGTSTAMVSCLSLTDAWITLNNTLTKYFSAFKMVKNATNVEVAKTVLGRVTMDELDSILDTTNFESWLKSNNELKWELVKKEYLE